MTIEIRNLESRLTGKTPFERVLNAVSLILDSPNGEYRRVFNFFSRLPEVRKPLAERISPETGLMQENYFRQRVTSELETIQNYQKKHGKILQSTYVLFNPEDVEKSKEHLKTNNLASTKLIGTVDGMVAALLPCDVKTAKQTLKKYEGTASFVQYEPGKTLEQMHYEAKEQFKEIHKLGVEKDQLRLQITKNINKADVKQIIDIYLKTKDQYEKLVS